LPPHPHNVAARYPADSASREGFADESVSGLGASAESAFSVFFPQTEHQIYRDIFARFVPVAAAPFRKTGCKSALKLCCRAQIRS